METTVPVLASVPASKPEAPVVQPRLEQVGARARPAAVKVPSWFTAREALRVAELKGAEHLLVQDRGRVVGSISRLALAAAPAARPLGRCMPLISPIVVSDTPVSDARRLMEALGVDCLVVTAGPLLVGLVTRQDLMDSDVRAAE
jgi:CBS domain-containing protein